MTKPQTALLAFRADKSQLKNGVPVSYYLRITCSGGKVERFEELWVDPTGKVRKTTTPRVMEEVS